MIMHRLSHHIIRAGVVLASLVGLAVGAWAIPTSVELDGYAVIRDPECSGRARVLLRFRMPDELDHGVVDMAIARLEIVTQQQGASSVPVEAHVVTRAWDPESVTWDAGWATGQGSWDDTRVCGGVVRFGRTPALGLDVSELLGASARSRATDFDIVLLTELDAFSLPVEFSITAGDISLDYSVAE